MYLQLLISLCIVSLIQPQLAQSQADAQSETTQTTKYAVDFKTHDGLHVGFPYYSTEIQSVEEGMRESVRNVAIKIMEYIDRLVEEMLRNPKRKLSIFRCFGISKDLYKIITNLPAEHERANDALAASTGFMKYIKERLCYIMRQAKEVEQQLEQRNSQHDYPKLEADLHSYIGAVIESLRKSPVGVYLSWGHGTVNGVLVEEKAAELVGRLRFHGYSGLLNTIDWLMSVIKVFTF